MKYVALLQELSLRFWLSIQPQRATQQTGLFQPRFAKRWLLSVFFVVLGAAALLGLFQNPHAATFVQPRYIAPGGINAGDCSLIGSPCATLAYAISQSAAGDTINAAAGTYVLTSTVTVNLANLTIQGAGSATTIFQVAQAVGNAFSISAAGVTLTDLQIQKTDVTGVHELILVNATGDNFTLQNNLIQGPDPGTPWSVNGIVSRALVSSTGGVTGLLIQNNTIKHLRQPAYFNPGTVGTVSNNNVSGTRGWVVDGATINFTGNTWGPPANQGADIALLASCNPADYPNLGALSNANNNAFISGQFVGASSGVGTIYVDDSAAPGGDGSQALPFQTIAAGITAVLPGGIVNVAAGNYVENPAISKPLSLIGANANIAGAGVRGAESIVRTNGNQTAVVGVTAANVTINGFTLDGDDPGLAGIALTSGDDTNASYGVRPTTAAVNNLTVSHNIIKKVEIGIRGDVAAQGNVVTQNWFDSIGHFDFGYCVSIRNNFYANVTNNKMTKAWTGVHINNHNGAGGPANFLITGNEIHAYAGGILYWLQYNQATGATISANTITAETGAVANNFGILVVTNQDAVNSTFTNNAISGHDYGVGLFNVPTSSNITLGATNSISGSKLAGVFLTDNLNFNPVGTTNFLAGGPGAASTVNLNGLSITGNVNTGVKLEGTTNMQTLNINGANISGGVTGLQVTGVPTALTGNTLNNTLLSGQSGDYVTLANTALDNLTINATAVSFDGVTGAAATTAQLFAIENKLTHAVDNSSLGFILVKTGSTTVTGTTPAGGLQRAIDLANPGDTVNAGPGTYIEDININKTLIVCGDGPASTTISGPIGGAGSTVAITANNVEFKNFKVTREGNTVGTWSDPNLNSAGLSIQGQAITGANIHDNLFTQNRSGIDINNSNGHTVRNNVLTDNRTGLIFRNQTDNLTLVENEITNNWTVGIVFLDGNAGASNTPMQQALNCTFRNNNISGNWYGQIVDRQSSAFIPTPGTTNLKNFSANWFGTNAPVVTTANSAEPGYAAQIPFTVPGGSATPPGGQPDIAGPASANFDLTPLLDVGTDTNVETTLGRGTYGFQGSFNLLNVITTNAQTGATGRIQEGVNLVSTGGTVKAMNGSYTENTNVNKAATLLGTPTINGTLSASVAGATLSPGLSPGIINSGDLALSAGSVVSIELNGVTAGTGYDQLNVTGTVSLGGATLNLTSGFTPPSGATFTIINNDDSDPVTGTFNGLPEGTVINVGGTPMKITYVGGVMNNDVVLIANSSPVASNNSATTNQNTPVTITLTAMDADGNNLTFMIVDAPLHGTLGLLSAPVCSGNPSTCTVTVTYTPAAPYAGPDSFTFKANDGTLDSNLATVSITVAATSVFVDDDFTGSTNGSTVFFPGDPNPHIFGADAFATIQNAINAVVAPGIVNVAPGTYAENVTVNKNVNMKGAQQGVNACGRSASESTITGTGTLLTLAAGSAGSIINGFTFSGGTRGIESTGGPLNNLQLLNNRVVGFTGNGVFLNDPGTDIIVHQNAIDGGSKTGSGGLFHLDTDLFNGFQFTSNCITGKGATDTSTGFFVDGNHNVGPSGARNPLINGNSITACQTGMNLGTRAFGSLTIPNTGTISNNTFSNNLFDGLQGGIQNTLITGNTFSGNGRHGLALTSFGNTNTDRGGQNTTIKANLISGNGFNASPNNGAGIFFSGTQAVGTIGTNRANFNRIVGNNVGVQYGSSVAAGNNATIDIENNWWGCNFGPGATGTDCAGLTNSAVVFAGNSGVLDFNPWLTLTLAANPATIIQGGSATLTAKLTLNSDNADTAPMMMYVPNGTPVSFAATLGTIAPSNTVTTNGMADSIFTAGIMPGASAAATTVDGQTISTSTTINGQGIIVQCIPLTFTPASPLPPGTVGSPYPPTTFTATGASGGPADFAITMGGLPPGMMLTTAGVLSGTPTATGTFNFKVLATDPVSCTGVKDYSLTILCPTITLPPTLSNGVQGATYTQSVAAVPAGPTYNYAVTTNVLPPGLSLHPSTGAITGTPSAPGNYTFVITATAFGTCASSRSYNVMITGTCAPITLTPTTLPGATLGLSYNQTVSATGGVAPYTFNIASGVLPPGLTLDANSGLISGTPTTTGTFTTTIRATGQGGCTGQRLYVISVVCGTVTIGPPTIAAATESVAYSQQLTANVTGTFSLQLGSLPPGFTLNSAGLLSGITSQRGTYNFTVRLLAGSCQSTRAYTLVVNAAVFRVQPALALNADYDGDGQTDPTLWSATTGRWSIVRSSDQRTVSQTWGTAGDLSLLGDYDGDGKSDLAVFRPSDGAWYVRRSSDGGSSVKIWGVATDVPVPGDYDGDGRTDLAVFRPNEGNWYVLRSSDEQATVIAWGAGAAPYLDTPVPGDYDGDGKTDVAVFRRANGTWLVKRSSDSQYVVKVWGVGSDVPVANDYDGDGQTDLAVWRGATGVWYIWQSTTNNHRTATWGAGYAPYHDQTAPGDYDGDGQADLAVWRTTDQTWYIQRSLDGSLMARTQGQVGDVLAGKAR